MDKETGQTIISGASNLLGELAHNVAQNRNLKLQNKYNQKMAEFQFQKDVEMWNLQNQYNQPANQMKRLDAAGLNPNLVYGTGSVTGNVSSGSLPHYNAPSKSFDFQPMIPNQFPNILAQYQDFKVKQAQINNLEAQTKATNTRAALDAFKVAYTDEFGHENAMNDAQIRLVNANMATDKHRLTMYQADKAKVELDNLDRQLKARTRGYEIKNEYEKERIVFQKFLNEFMKMGVTQSDNILIRLLTRSNQNEVRERDKKYKAFDYNGKD